MSYGCGAALQEAVYAALLADPALAAEVGAAVHDALPPGPAPDLYVALGPEEVLGRGDVTGRGALHRFTVSVVSGQPGFAGAKRAAVAVSDALDGADLALSRGHLVALRLERVRARRTDGAALRRIDLRFAARIEDD